ncbi:DUF6624 domain-containing protein [Mucilaginibacter sp. KACC 22063]|uniref:DUF6624 domain-containing protein n=1 Tax=Mucilaginibacter sp. KACC 22063 TaxID=3025666 RepID=UPI002366ED1F|nr:DUF6624 domain-containing protein [Mucilaginibacter sp. KACC 22063]WDF53346.1 hypothetical protein PQ461_10340 [Mucilaginibacter sp. KACC 22063]
MKLFTVLLVSLCGISSVMAQSIPCNDTAQITIKLKSIRKADQESRAQFIKQMAENNPEKAKQLALQMKATDKQNQQEIGELLDNCGWPKGLSAEDNHTLFLVIDHAETTYMKKYFPLLKDQADKGIVPKSDLATLQDRILLRSGEKQLYGTQTFKDGAIIRVWPIDEVEHIDQRRKEMGLPPIDEYLATVKSTYKSEVSWDKEMTIEDARQKVLKKP